MLRARFKYALKVIFVIVVIVGLLASYIFTGLSPASRTEPEAEINFTGPTGEPAVVGPTTAPSVAGPAKTQ